MSDNQVLSFEDARKMYLSGLNEAMNTRTLTKLEVMAIVEGQIFDNLSESTIPELQLMVKDLTEGFEKDNALLFIQVAEEFAKGMRRDIEKIMWAHREHVKQLSLWNRDT